MTKHQKDHLFYCFKKNCRKSAWQTPEYLTKEDWSNLPKIIEIIQNNDVDGFMSFMENKDSVNFFNCVIGWPEGYTYCQQWSFTEKTALPGMKRYNLPNLIKSLENYNSTKSLT